jgi:hypothetical protein
MSKIPHYTTGGPGVPSIKVTNPGEIPYYNAYTGERIPTPQFGVPIMGPNGTPIMPHGVIVTNGVGMTHYPAFNVYNPGYGGY